MRFCKYCGALIEDNTLLCPMCNKDLSEKNKEYNQILQNKRKQEIKSVSISFIHKHKKIFTITFLILCIMFVGISIASITSSDYHEYKNYYLKFVDKGKEMLTRANNADDAYLKGSYIGLSEDYKDMSHEVLFSIWKIRVKSIIFAVLAVLSGVASYKIINFDKTNLLYVKENIL